MPLIIMTGTPASGKSRRTAELKQYFKEQSKDVHIISEFEHIKKAGFEVNSFYKDAQKEKQIRGILKSEVQRLIGPKNLVILDAGNYIKGYRYELYCSTKANKCTQCTVQCMINFEQAFGYNNARENDEEKYTRETFDALNMRYEDPDSKNRWDAPLFVVQSNGELDFKSISESLFDKKPPPPNMSTQNPPLSDTNFLYELDRVTNELSQQIIGMKKLGNSRFKVPGHDLTIDIDDLTIPKLNMLRRQYLTYSKMHTPDVNKILILFAQYLKSNLEG